MRLYLMYLTLNIIFTVVVGFHRSLLRSLGSTVGNSKPSKTYTIHQIMINCGPHYSSLTYVNDLTITMWQPKKVHEIFVATLVWCPNVTYQGDDNKNMSPIGQWLLIH